MNSFQYDAILEEAKEFGERFPDEYSATVLEHIAYIRGKYIIPESLIAKAILLAYEGKMTEAKGMLGIV